MEQFNPFAGIRINSSSINGGNNGNNGNGGNNGNTSSCDCTPIIIKQIELNTTSWQQQDNKFVQTIEENLIEDNSFTTLFLNNATEKQVDAAAKAKILIKNQNKQIIFEAFGDKPEVNIPIVLTINKNITIE